MFLTPFLPKFSLSVPLKVLRLWFLPISLCECSQVPHIQLFVLPHIATPLQKHLFSLERYTLIPKNTCCCVLALSLLAVFMCLVKYLLYFFSKNEMITNYIISKGFSYFKIMLFHVSKHGINTKVLPLLWSQHLFL